MFPVRKRSRIRLRNGLALGTTVCNEELISATSAQAAAHYLLKLTATEVVMLKDNQAVALSVRL